MDTIMGQNKEELLTISDKTAQGKISFFVVIGIVLICYAIYNLIMSIWSQHKIDILIQYKQELYKGYKKAINKNNHKNSDVREVQSIHTPLNNNSEEIIEKSSNPSNEDIAEAIDTLEYFRKKKYLKGR